MQSVQPKQESSWSEIIEPTSGLLDIKLSAVWHYRDLLRMFVKRDIVAVYKQSLLGPAWFFIQPILTTITFTIVFGRIAGLSSDGQPQLLFYLAGLTIWNYFSECFTKSSSVFVTNAGIFGKVYFPRLIMPLSIVISNLFRFGIQFLLFSIVLIYYMNQDAMTVRPNVYALLTPVLLIIMAGISLGAGMIFSALTTKYRDLTFLLSFGVQLLMYGTPVIYPLSSLSEQYRNLVLLNPISPIVETFRYGFLGSGIFSWGDLLYSSGFMIVLLFIGTLIFNKVEKSFMDTV